MNRSPWLLGMVGCLLVMAGGCSKRIPSTDLTFEAHQRVVLTFRNGDEIEGRISPGKRVRLRESKVTWSAVVGDVTEEHISLKNLTVVHEAQGVAMQTARAADARFGIGDPVPDKSYLRSEIVSVDRVKLDAARTARNATFWTYGAVVLTLLMGERS